MNTKSNEILKADSAPQVLVQVPVLRADQKQVFMANCLRFAQQTELVRNLIDKAARDIRKHACLEMVQFINFEVRQRHLTVVSKVVLHEGEYVRSNQTKAMVFGFDKHCKPCELDAGHYFQIVVDGKSASVLRRGTHNEKYFEYSVTPHWRKLINEQMLTLYKQYF